MAHIQSRWGPHRVGPHGLLQPMADGIKFLFKEDIMPLQADHFIYLLAPFLAFTLAFLSFAVIPFGESFKIGDRTILLQILPERRAFIHICSHVARCI